MNPKAKNTLAIVIGLLVGSSVNMALVQTGYQTFPLPGNPDVSDMEQLKKAMSQATSKHYLFPFLAHALGTLVGAFLAAKLAATRPMTFAYAIGGFFLLGGIIVAFMIPGPVWFIALDWVLAYIPMAFVGGRLASKKQSAPV